MSASDITDSLITNLSAASVFGSGQVDTNYFVLERTSACCAVVSFAGLADTPWGMQNQREAAFTHSIEIYVKDTSGNASVIEMQLQGMVDTSVCSLRSDRALQGNPDIREMGEIRASHDIQTVADVNGAAWFFAIMEVDTREWPSNT